MRFPQFFARRQPRIRFRVLVIFVLFVLNFILITLVFVNFNSAKSVRKFPEVRDLEKKNLTTYPQFSAYFADLAKHKGAQYAYDFLKVAKMPPNIDLHLLGHTVGDVLYKQRGIDGIEICTDDFRNACSHSVVVGALLEKGVSALPAISAVCRKAPGGKGAFTMCYHGLGHGVLSYTSFDVKSAIALCQKTDMMDNDFGASTECTGGVVMEIMGGGFHDKKTWGEQRKKYLDKSVPLALCQADFMPVRDRERCYMYITPFMIEAVGGDMGNLTNDAISKSFPYCATISETDANNRDICYRGFGKEFLAIAGNRDIRKQSIESLTDTQLATVSDACQMAQVEKGIIGCELGALSSLYWGGENNRSVSIRFCNILNGDVQKVACFNDLIGQAAYFISDTLYKRQFCSELPEQYKSECVGRII